MTAEKVRDFSKILGEIATGHPLDEATSEAAFEMMMAGAATEAQMGAFLMGLRVRGETVTEIVAAARVMRARALKVAAPQGAIDTCGTGGDGSGSLNISTATSFVVAALGVPVSKHGNRAISSKAGAADVLEALGVAITLPPAAIGRCIAEAGVGFLLAPLHHAAMGEVAAVRRQLGTRTIFNLLGPLTNPAGAKRQLVGVFAPEWVGPVAEVLKSLGSERVWVVHGSDGLDELTTTGPSLVAELRDGEILRYEITPEEAGLARARPADLKGGNATENAAAIRALLDGAAGPFRDIVLLNSAAALIIAEKATTLAAGAALAAQAIDEGRARQVLERLIFVSNAEAAA